MPQQQIQDDHIRPRILFVDDHRFVLDAVASMAHPRYEVLGIDCILDLEQKLNTFLPDLVVLDIRLPDGDGFQVARRILESRPKLKVMFLSMHTEAKFVTRGMSLGAHAYVSKRAPALELLFAIETVLEGGKYLGPELSFAIGEDDNGREDLTERQQEVLRLISLGRSAKEIASELNISVRTAEYHRAAIMDRLKLHSTAMMTRYALEHGIA